jgi:signal transduction histidine kinase
MQHTRWSVDGFLVPLLARAGLLTFGAAIASSARYAATRGEPGADTSGSGYVSAIVLPALILLIIGAAASPPLPAAVPRVMLPLAESVAASIVIGTLGEPVSTAFIPYLLVPVATVGLSGGFAAAGLCAAMASAGLLGSLASSRGPDALLSATGAWPWPLILVAVGLLAAWVRRVRTTSPAAADPAYADAHRLLSELHVVARHLSLGLDPHTVAAALLEDLRGIAGPVSATALVRSESGRFVPLVGDDLPDSAASAIDEAWTSSSAVRRTAGDLKVVAIPVRMGVGVVAIVVLTGGDGDLDDDAVRLARDAVSRSGPRLATALLFDDVRRLATVDERTRLAREIHDGIAQDLASVGYLLDDIATDAGPETAERLGGLRRHLRDLVSELRLSIFDLRTGVDDQVSLGTAAGEYVQRIGPQSGLAVHVSLDEGTVRLPTAVEVELLRILQEAVTNVRKHAQAKNLWLSLAVDAPSARLTVADDGLGLQPRRADSMGLTGMSERAKRIGAALEVGASEHGGTVVEVILDGARGSAGATSPVRSVTSDSAASHAPWHAEQANGTAAYDREAHE